MSADRMCEITRLLDSWRRGDLAAADALLPFVEGELRRLADSYMRRERPGHTLQPTALVNEAWLRLAGQSATAYESRAHFIAIAASYMRQILVDHARRRNASKRGGGGKRVSLTEAASMGECGADLLALDDALTDLAALDARQSQIVVLRYFGGLEHQEIAAYLKIGRSTVIRELRMAEAWLKQYVTG